MQECNRRTYKVDRKTDEEETSTLSAMSSNNQFHSFMDYANGEVTGINEHNIPGIVVPQKLYTAPGTNSSPNMPRIAFFVNGVPGLRLQDALQPAGPVMDNAGSIPDIPIGGQRASFRILVCFTCCVELKMLLSPAFSGPGMILGTL